MTTVGDYLRKLAEQFGEDPEELIEKYVEQRRLGAQQRDALKAIEEMVRARVVEATSAALAEEELLEAEVQAEKPAADIGKWIKSREWLTADDVKCNDELEIISQAEIDTETFDAPQAVLKVKHGDRTVKLRLGKQNAQRIATDFGTTDTALWVGRKIFVDAVLEYPALKAKGMILRGKKE